MKPKCYISGKMSGVQRAVYLERFGKAEELVREAGYQPVNPCRFAVCRWPWLYKLVGYRLTLLYDLWRLSQCDRIYLIPTWEQSTGAKIESFFAFQMPTVADPQYHIRRLPQDIKDRIDKQMEKLIKKESRDCADCTHYDDNNPYGKGYCEIGNRLLTYDEKTCNQYKEKQ